MSHYCDCPDPCGVHGTYVKPNTFEGETNALEALREKVRKEREALTTALKQWRDGTLPLSKALSMGTVGLALPKGSPRLAILQEAMAQLTHYEGMG